MDLHQYLQAIRKFWPVILIPAVLAGLSGVYSASQAVTEHQAAVTFFIGTSGDDTNSGAVQGDEFAQRRVNSYIELASTDRLAQMVAGRPDIDLEADQVRRMLGAKGDLDTVLLTATATSTSPALAMEVADAVAVEFVSLVEEVESLDGGPASVRLQVVSGPTVRELPGQGKLMTALRAMIGLALGVGVALLLELRDNAIRDDGELAELETGPVLGRIPYDRRVRTYPLIVEADQQSALAESFRQLRTNLQFIDVELPVQVLVVTSSVAEEGKSVVASNLALSLSAASRRVLLVEADLRRPTVSDHFGLDRRRGLTDVIAGHARFDEVAQVWVDDGLAVLPSGPLPPNPSELLGSTSMRNLVDRLRDRFDVIIVDTPPLLPVTDGAVASSWADGVLLAVRSGRSTRHQVAHSVNALRAVNARLLGVVMTMAPPSRTSGYDSYERLPTARVGPLRRSRERLEQLMHSGPGERSSRGIPAPRPADLDAPPLVPADPAIAPEPAEPVGAAAAAPPSHRPGPSPERSGEPSRRPAPAPDARTEPPSDARGEERWSGPNADDLERAARKLSEPDPDPDSPAAAPASSGGASRSGGRPNAPTAHRAPAPTKGRPPSAKRKSAPSRAPGDSAHRSSADAAADGPHASGESSGQEEPAPPDGSAAADGPTASRSPEEHDTRNSTPS